MENSSKQSDLSAPPIPKFTVPQSSIDCAPRESTGIAKNIGGIQGKTDSSLNLDDAQPLDPATFPNLTSRGDIKGTIANVDHLLRSYKIAAKYNVATKKLLIAVPGHSGTQDNFDNVVMTKIFSLASLNGMPTGQLVSFVTAIGDRHQFNPVAEWIMSEPWDGVDRLQAMCDTLVHREDFPAGLKRVLIHRWLVSAVAAAMMPTGFRARGVLTLQGSQSIGKTSWISALVPDPILREMSIKLDHHLDAGNKDSLITAVSHWIVEIGELDSSFKKDVARLKGFLTSDRDKVRRPYGRTDSEYPRRTVFAATVNDSNFLVDATGNSRWWTIPITQINFQHGIDMQRLFAQIAVDFNAGQQWWLTPEEEKLLEEHNKQHRSVSVIEERMLDAIDLSKKDGANLPAMTATQLLLHIGIKNPTNPQSKECAAVLRSLLGDSKRIHGANKWRIPLKQQTWTPALSPSSSTAMPAKDEDEMY